MIRIRTLRKSFKAQQGVVNALRDIDLDVAEGDFCVLLGPSGCGKTTTWGCVGGLEEADGGESEIGMVFQSYAIWPHMNVFQHAAFPPTQGQTRVSNSLVADRVRTALKRVQL